MFGQMAFRKEKNESATGKQRETGFSEMVLLN
jgi:hypothetical protein